MYRQNVSERDNLLYIISKLTNSQKRRIRRYMLNENNFEVVEEKRKIDSITKDAIDILRIRVDNDRYCNAYLYHNGMCISLMKPIGVTDAFNDMYLYDSFGRSYRLSEKKKKDIEKFVVGLSWSRRLVNNNINEF